MLVELLAQAAAEEAVANGGWTTDLNNPWIYGGLLAVAVIAATVIGNLIAKRSRMDDSGWRFAIVIGSILVSLLVISAKWPPKYGVDLRGGVVLVGQIDKDAMDSDPESGTFRMQDLISKLKGRIDPTNLREISIRSQGTDRIEAVIPDVDDVEAERIWKKMTTMGFLEFRMVAIDLEGGRAKELAEQQANSPDPTVRRSRVVTESGQDGQPGKVVANWYDIGRVSLTATESESGESPAYRMVPVPQSLVRDAATGRIVNSSLYAGASSGEELQARAEAQKINQLQILLLEPIDERYQVDGDDIRATRRGSKGFEPIVEFTMTSAGARKMGRFTDFYRPVGNQKHFMAVVLDGNVMTAPSINSPIYDQGLIEGSFTEEEVDDLVSVLNSGRIKVALKKNYVSLDSVQSSLGEEMKQRGIYAIGISLLLVLIFMAVYYYQFAGLIACTALLLNILLVGASLLAVGQAITLTGLAGFVLTVGMSVDANVLIFERIREELKKGAAIRMAIRNGFDRAMSTIIDANVTTLITAVVLYVIGTEQLKSFAVILILGILASMFTAIFVSRLVFDFLERRRMITGLAMMQIANIERFSAIGLSRVMVPISLVVVVVSIAASLFRGAEIFDYDLRGGSSASVIFMEKTSQSDVSAALNAQTILNETGEKVQFMVSEMTTAGYEPGTYFKVESTLSVPEDGEEDSDFRSLKTVIKETFGPKLRRLNVTASELKDVTTPDTVGRKSNRQPNLWENPIVYASIPNTELPNGDWQDQQGSESTGNSAEQETETQEQETETEQVAETDSQEANQEGEAQDGEAQDGVANPTQELPPSTLPPNVESPQLPEDPANDTSGSEVLVEFTLTYEIPVTLTTVLDQLTSTSDQLDLGIPEENFVVTASSGQKRDKSFSVRVRAPSVEAVQSVVTEMQQSLSSEPFFPSASTFGSQVAGQAQLQALMALFASLVGIVLYIWFRFQHIWFGLAAVVALLHDVVVVLGCIAISYWIYAALGGFLLIDNFRISLSVVAALLTVVGYSLNDTIVVFDRIREVRGRSQKFTEEMIDTAIGQTLNRTILTSLTTFLVVFILFGWGGSSIHAFAFALVIGVVVGTYSSIFIASPVLLWLMKYKFIELDPVTEEKPSVENA